MNNPQSSFEVQAGTDAGPLQQMLTDKYNDFHEALVNGDPIRQRSLRDEVPELLLEFLETERLSHPHPDWIGPVMEGGWAIAQEQYKKAYEFEWNGWVQASHGTPRRSTPEKVIRWRAISAANMSEVTRRLKDGPGAVAWGELACSLEPDRGYRKISVGMGLYVAGQRAAADAVLLPLVTQANFKDPRDKVAMNLLYERELLTYDLQAVRLLRTKIGGGR